MSNHPSPFQEPQIVYAYKHQLEELARFRKALEVISRDSYLCEHDNEFKPTRVALEAQAALSGQ